jgi:hypothetical protein
MMGANEDINPNDPRLVQPKLPEFLKSERHDDDDHDHGFGPDCPPQAQPGNIPPAIGTLPMNDIQEETWFKSEWRPAAAWFYLFICFWDFFLAPIALAAYAAALHVPYIAWAPLTLGGGAIFHLSFGAIIGIYAYSRTREKLADK